MEKNKPLPTVALPEKDLEAQCPAEQGTTRCERHAGHTFQHVGYSPLGEERTWNDSKPEEASK